MFKRKFSSNLNLYLRQGGLSLIELSFVILIILLFSLFECQVVGKQFVSMQMKICQNKIINMLRLSYNLSFANNSTIYLMPCAEHDKNINNWKNSFCILDYQKKIIKKYSGCDGNYQIKWQGFRSKKYVIFSPDMFHAQSNGTFSLFSSKYQVNLKILVNRIGVAHEFKP